ncbi:protein kinase domain-containing protein [Streptomyces rishiriensis]|uniref:protein kinase domain-containing protein n=1 Tax=Streptomyces rishiriensis TaxID=68264 RepID=UPI0037D28DCF
MSDQLPPPPNSAAEEAAALRQTGASPLRTGDPDRVGPFVPVALLGSGGMGRVYLARAADDSPGLFAVKVIRPEYAEDVRFQRRFEREAAVHGRLGPPHAPGLRGTGWDDRLLWMATEYIPGLDLADAVRGGGALPTAAVWRLTAELARALTALAAVEVVHRDLKPSNVLVSPQGAYVIDFGISKALDASAITGTGNRVGTAAYMSPEYLRTGHCDTASDVFSLAGTLLYAATGRAPFGDGTGVDVMHRVAFEEPNTEVTAAVAAADPELGALLTACLAKEPERRPAPRDLIDAVGGRALATGWPEPLRSAVLARQRAYETLHRLPVEHTAWLRPLDNRAGRAGRAQGAGRADGVTDPPAGRRPEEASPATPSGRGSRERDPAPAAAVAAAGTASPASGPVSGPVSPVSAARPRARRKRVAALASVAALCTVAAGAFSLMREDGPATASPRASESAYGSRPGGVPGAGAGEGAASPGAPDRASAAGSSSRRADVVTAEEETTPSLPSAPRSATAGAGSTPSAPAADVSASPSPSPDATPVEPGSPPWLSNCTYYAGSGRTSLGDTGKRVRQAQCMLAERGYGVGASGVDGTFDADTETAVRGFQSDRGLKANGVVTKATWAALRADD